VDVLWWHASQLGAVTGRCSRRKLAVAAANNSFTIPYVCMVKAPALLPNKASILFPAFVSLRSCTHADPALPSNRMVQPFTTSLFTRFSPQWPWNYVCFHLPASGSCVDLGVLVRGTLVIWPLPFACRKIAHSCVHDGGART
jgi:hypothetical protein